MADIFRKEYKPLSENQVVQITAIKDEAEKLLKMIDPPRQAGPGDRAIAIARTKLEECVMWAIKGLTE